MIFDRNYFKWVSNHTASHIIVSVFASVPTWTVAVDGVWSFIEIWNSAVLHRRIVLMNLMNHIHLLFRILNFLKMDRRWLDNFFELSATFEPVFETTFLFYWTEEFIIFTVNLIWSMIFLSHELLQLRWFEFLSLSVTWRILTIIILWKRTQRRPLQRCKYITLAILCLEYWTYNLCLSIILRLQTQLMVWEVSTLKFFGIIEHQVRRLHRKLRLLLR